MIRQGDTVALAIVPSMYGYVLATEGQTATIDWGNKIERDVHWDELVEVRERITYQEVQRLGAARGREGRILRAGADLLSDDGENIEYDRGVAEAVAAILEQDKETVATVLRGIKKALSR